MVSRARSATAALPIENGRGSGGVVRIASRSLVHRLFIPVDIAAIVAFRIAFGAFMFVEMLNYLSSGWVTTHYIDPPMHFPFVGFEWVRPWPGIGMYIHFWILAALALGIMLGCWYRVSATLFCLGFTYIFLMEKAYYLNHFYLICLLSFLMIFIPANRACSIDALIRPSIRSDTAATWTLWILRAQLGIVYIFGGIAKLNSDWFRGEPMRMWLRDRTDFPIIGRWFTDEWMVYLFSYGGLVVDLLIVPLVLWRRTRLPAIILAVAFHLINANLFQIGIFPWFMIAATVLFLPPNFPRRIVTSRPPTTFTRSALGASQQRLSRRQILITSALIAYVTVQIAVPLRHLAYPGNVSWTEEGHRFSWHMKLRSKSGEIRFYATDPATGETVEIDPSRYLTSLQIAKMSTHPDMILQFSHVLARELRTSDDARVEIRVWADASLNGRPPQLLIDPTVDLAAEHHSLAPASWILPLSGTASSAQLPRPADEPRLAPPW